MAGRRTDLALEAKEIWEEGAAEAAVLEGVEAAAGEREGFPTETVRILDRRGEEALGKPAGRYVTLTLDGLARREEGAFGRAARAVAGELAGLLEGVPAGGLALVVGLGNRAITPDALGPKVHDHTLVTRHLVEGCPEQFGGFRPVAALSAGVLGTTGMESGELLVKELLCPPEDLDWVVERLPGLLPRWSSAWRTPEGTHPFGMLKWLDPELERSWDWSSTAYLGLAFD